MYLNRVNDMKRMYDTCVLKIKLIMSDDKIVVNKF